MIDDEFDHAAFVDAWLERSTKGQAPDQSLDVFAASLNALWKCASDTLGDVTLHAILDRVLYNARERFPFLSGLEIEAHAGVQARGLPDRASALNGPELKSGLRFVLTEFLTVIGSLTAEILSPELHAELARVTPGKAGRQKEGVPVRRARRGHERTKDEDQ
jgi:hypothetical protein